ncbi:MAG TPA: D-alanyl-lipoteichoic acid biosynthesis protein DltB [Symbiobacteriaceae bacterium]|nr:D-alanyl-lipoteichoic acid biosynthesis protein DltB [Symbiobacteriaceae bacterium]
MTPYGTFAWFGFLLYPALPALGLGLWGRLSRWFVLGVTLVMLALQYGVLFKLELSAVSWQFWQLLIYAGYMGAVVRWFAAAKVRKAAPWTFTLAVGLGVLPLVLAKVLPVFHVSGLVGFVGISYVTFRSLDVIFGLQDGLIKAIRLRDFWLYLLFFPTISSGPIDRYRRFMKDWEQPRTRAEYLQDIDAGIHRLFRGFFYKFLVAYLIKQFVMQPLDALPGFWPAVGYMYAYSLYLFFDFAGYSAFAVGVSYLFGVRSPENFDRPWLASNIRDFWNRWHISLSTWFRDHVYMRFVMWATRRKLVANRHVVAALASVVSMGLMGVWHGLQWHYIVYGFYHAALMIGFDWLSRWNKERKVWGQGPVWRWLGVFMTAQCVCFGLLIFSGKLF